MSSGRRKQQREQRGPTWAPAAAGALGGLAWVAAAFVGGAPGKVLVGGGALLITWCLLDVGLHLVRSGLPALRLFVACALPLLFWMVVLFATGAVDANAVVWGVAGAAVAAFAAALLARLTRARATA